jgi:hypothetical protein
MKGFIFFGKSTYNQLPVYLNLDTNYNFSNFGKFFIEEDKVLPKNQAEYLSCFELFSAIGENVYDVQCDQLMHLCNLITTANKARIAGDLLGYDDKVLNMLKSIALELEKLFN